MSSNPVQAACNHTTHLFYDIFCPNSSLTERVTTVVLGGLLLIGGIFTVSAISKYLFTPSYPEIPEVGKEARKFAIESLESHPEITPFKFTAFCSGDNTLQPVNTQIAKLRNLYEDVHFKAFEEALKNHPNNPWEQDEVLQAADAIIKVAYTISCLTLEDLKPFTEQNKRTYAEALTVQDSYQYRTFYYCTLAYHWIRGGAVWNDKEEGYIDHSTTYNGRIPVFTTKAHAQTFYTDGTMQNSWNQLYNDYCDRVRSYVKEEDLRRADSRHVEWTIKDTEIGNQLYNDYLDGVKSPDEESKIPTFYHTPDTLPT
jgi:hypothetical protein